jgi:hypothetical protein
MATKTLTVKVTLRWWVKPALHVLTFLFCASGAALFMDEQRLGRLTVWCGEQLARYGVKLEAE